MWVRLVGDPRFIAQLHVIVALEHSMLYTVMSCRPREVVLNVCKIYMMWWVDYELYMQSMTELIMMSWLWTIYAVDDWVDYDELIMSYICSRGLSWLEWKSMSYVYSRMLNWLYVIPSYSHRDDEHSVMILGMTYIHIVQHDLIYIYITYMIIYFISGKLYLFYGEGLVYSKRKEGSE